MKFNTKTRYGLRVVLELALNADNEGGTYQKDIAKKQDVSVKYLDHIISSLKKAGLIINVGGKKSGYVLGRPANEINIYNIYAAFEDDLAIIDCLLTDSECPNRGNCVLRDYWCNLNESIRVSMSAMDVATLADKHRNGHVAE
jgi:Rrf2 family protein